ncbi:hypothetical protein KC909_03935 [Candidatus Dojkabacteria bacterium]|uniref:Uncharacterized protein n=1 Tax=Candidatus Dojkabacteria bacterium TaxID=2099670 RepID=A0A955RJK7_9BACT|nr:hypothetical protein [Candidatus Dojkabacteria bacterium]
MKKNTHLEGKESLLFTLGAISSWILLKLNTPNWLTAVTVISLAVVAEIIVKFLIKKNVELQNQSK